MTDRDELLLLIKDIAVVHGRVTLSSGAEADYYIDLRRITLHRAGAPLWAACCASSPPTGTTTPSVA